MSFKCSPTNVGKSYSKHICEMKYKPLTFEVKLSGWGFPAKYSHEYGFFAVGF